MEIKKVGGAGLHASELKAISKMEQQFQNSWHGYAGLIVSDPQGPMEIDCLIITHDRLLLVELKEWNGTIEYDNGMWVQNGQNRGKSPFAIKREHALRLQKLLDRELSHNLGYWLTVEAHVVLCGNATPNNLPLTERPFVHSLDEFLAIRAPEKYDSLVTNKKLAGFFNNTNGKPRPNSEKALPIICSYFDGPKIRKKELVVGNFQANTNKPWFAHRNGIYKEFLAQDRSMTSTKGLIRRWDFNKLGTLHALQSTWSNIALRENRIGKFIRDNSNMRDYLLRYVNDVSVDDITEDFCELYELPRNTERLDEVIASDCPSWSREQRLDRVRALLAPFGDLHALNIAHRDIDPHNLWYAQNHNSILTSGFGAAFFPETGTVADHRKLLQSSPVALPEDAMCVGDIIDAFRIDVFLLALVAYQICFNQRLEQVDGVPEWTQPVNDPFDGLLTAWFEKALSWDSAQRFDGAHSMLAEFNAITGTSTAKDDEPQQIFEQLLHSPYRRQELTPYLILQTFPPSAEKQEEAYKALANGNNKKAYVARKDNNEILVKLWENVQVSQNQPGSNRRVLQFLKRLEKFQEATLATPKLLEFGLMNPHGLFVVTEYVEGETWSSYLLDLTLSLEDKRDLAINLVNTVMDFHDKRFSHGDLHPENIILKDSNAEKIMLVDVLDYGTETEAFNTDYGPANPAITDAYGRDRFAVFKIVEELFAGDLPLKVQEELFHARDNQTQIPIDLAPLLNALKTALDTEKLAEPEQPFLGEVEEEEPILLSWGASSFPTTPKLLEPLDGGYYFNCKWIKSRDNGTSKELACFITGNTAYLQVNLDVEARKITKVRHRDSIPLSDVVSAQRRSVGRLSQSIALKNGALDERCALVDAILNMEPVIDAIVDQYSNSKTISESPLTDEERQELSPEMLWQALADSEGQLRQSIQIESGAEDKISDSGHPMYPYVCLDGHDLQIDADETYYIYQPNSDEKLGELVQHETTGSYVAIQPVNYWAAKQFTAGKSLQLESIRSKSSRDLRLKALKRVIDKKSVIPNLADYFDTRHKAALREMAERPSVQKLRELYDAPGRETNNKQLEAFQLLVSQGPVGVLQGPPGTGKTTFVSKFIHYLFEHAGANNILLVGQQHSAVDNVAIKARELCSEKGLELDTIRIGNESMIDDRMLPTHTRALQQKIRHRFHREYDMRVSALSSRLQLPHDLVQDATRLHRNLAPLLVQLGQYDRQREKLIRTGGEANEIHANQLIELMRQRNQTLETIETIVRKQFNSALGDLPTDSELLFDKLLQLLAQSHGVNNPVKVGRLHQLLSISQEWLDVLRSGEAGYERFMLKTKQLACGTLVGVGRRSLELEQSQFDWVIVDEAGRAQASELMVALQSAKRILLVGDHKQLPPFYQNGHIKHASRVLDISQDAFQESDFERAFKACGGVTLDTQYRMIKPIGDLVSACFYAEDIGKLHTARGPAKTWYDELPAPWNKGVSWIDTTSEQGEKEAKPGYTNQREIELLLQSLRTLVDAEAVENLQKTVTNEHPHPIGIITMYKAQKIEIETRLNQAEWMGPLRNLIRIDTVDSYQGQENKIIILSLVRDNPRSLQGFLRDAPRINVAISRAQERLLLLGASRMWHKDNNDSALGSVYEYIAEQVSQNNSHYQIITNSEFNKEAIPA